MEHAQSNHTTSVQDLDAIWVTKVKFGEKLSAGFPVRRACYVLPTLFKIYVKN